MAKSSTSTMSRIKPDASTLNCGCEARAIPDWPGYMVSEDGRVFSNKHRGIWKEVGCNKPNPSGYWMVTLRDQGRYRLELVHRLVMRAFVGESPDGLVVRHINGNPGDNRLQNLAYGTPKENADDKWTHGTQRHGESHWLSKFTDKDILEIRSLKASGVTGTVLAKRYRTSSGAITKIIKGQIWSHLPTFPYKNLAYKHDDAKILSIRLRYKNSETVRQIADDLGMNVRTVRSYIRYELRKSLVPTEESCRPSPPTKTDSPS